MRESTVARSQLRIIFKRNPFVFIILCIVPPKIVTGCTAKYDYYFYYYGTSFNSCVKVGLFSRTSKSHPDSGRSSTFRRMCALPSIAVFANWGSCFFQGSRGGVSTRLLLVAPRAPITIGTTLMFHSFDVPHSLIFNLRSSYFSIFSLSFSTMCVSFGIATSIMSPFVCLSITTKSGLRACICLSVLISKSHSTLSLSFSLTGLGLWSQMLSVVLIS